MKTLRFLRVLALTMLTLTVTLLNSQITMAQDWVRVTDGRTPANALRGGNEADGTLLYIARATIEGGVHIGKVRANAREAYFPYGGREVSSTNYEVFVGTGTWQEVRSGQRVPATAIAGGREANGSLLYIARASIEGGIHPGKSNGGEAWVPYGGQERYMVPFQVLVGPTILTGLVDMHTHPMSRWAFGEELFWGENDGNPAVALGKCQCFHRGWDLLQNQCGNTIRESVVNQADIAQHHTGDGSGFPAFQSFPKSNAILHQQMWWEWIKNAKEHGLKVMVALAVNNHCIADLAETAGPNDDLRSMNTQINKLKEFVGRHTDFMEIAYSPVDLRRIVGSNKLAVIIGIEMDNIGNFYNPADRKGGTFNPNPTEEDINREIDRLYNLGVRYMFPIHITNNIFGGTALYIKDFNVSNKYNTGLPFAPEVIDSPSSGITFKLVPPYMNLGGDYAFLSTFNGNIIPGHVMPNNRANYPNYPDPGPNQGHRNSLGLSDKGRIGIRYMMKRGIMLDIDHMSEKSANETIEIAKQNNYPVNSGHNGIRPVGGTSPNISENSRTEKQLRDILTLGGMFGLGHGDGATGFVKTFKEASRIMNNRQLALGTDVNGLYKLPGAPTSPQERVDYVYTMGTKRWSFNSDGFVHYGMLSAYLQSATGAGLGLDGLSTLYGAAEYFAQMWEKCERQKNQVR